MVKSDVQTFDETLNLTLPNLRRKPETTLNTREIIPDKTTVAEKSGGKPAAKIRFPHSKRRMRTRSSGIL